MDGVALFEFIKRDIVPVLAPQFNKGDAQGDGERPGDEGAAAFEGVNVV